MAQKQDPQIDLRPDPFFREPQTPKFFLSHPEAIVGTRVDPP
jgi:hypothetical protein